MNSRRFMGHPQAEDHTLPHSVNVSVVHHSKSHVSFRQLLRTYQRTRVQRLGADFVAKVFAGFGEGCFNCSDAIRYGG
jgi:hypothetical protein